MLSSIHLCSQGREYFIQFCSEVSTLWGSDHPPFPVYILPTLDLNSKIGTSIHAICQHTDRNVYINRHQRYKCHRTMLTGVDNNYAKTQLQAFTKLFINSCWEPISCDSCFPHPFALGMNQTTIQGVSLFSFYEKTQKIDIHRDTWKTCLKVTTLHTEYQITPHLRSYSLAPRQQNHIEEKQIYTRTGSFLQLIDGEKNHYQRIYNHEIERPSYLGWFQGEGGLNGKPWEADPCPKSRLWSCSISCDLRSLKKSSLVVSSTKVEDATIGCLPNSIPWHTKM
jgi:hypothetical protein